MAEKVLIVEDDATIGRFVELELTHAGFEVTRVVDGIAAVEAVRTDTPDIVLLDLMLPGMDGLTVCQRLRAASDVPILILTAKDAVPDRVKGLDAGADDYVVKPFSPRELVARIRAVFRRRAPELAGEVLQYGPIRLDAARHEILVDDQPLKMGLTEFKLLSYLLAHPERVFTRAQLLDAVWGDHVFIEERTVDVHMLRLRKALAPGGAQHLVRTVRGMGYRLSNRAEA